MACFSASFSKRCFSFLFVRNNVMKRNDGKIMKHEWNRCSKTEGGSKLLVGNLVGTFAKECGDPFFLWFCGRMLHPWGDKFSFSEAWEQRCGWMWSLSQRLTWISDLKKWTSMLWLRLPKQKAPDLFLHIWTSWLLYFEWCDCSAWRTFSCDCTRP